MAELDATSFLRKTECHRLTGHCNEVAHIFMALQDHPRSLRENFERAGVEPRDVISMINDLGLAHPARWGDMDVAPLLCRPDSFKPLEAKDEFYYLISPVDDQLREVFRPAEGEILNEVEAGALYKDAFAWNSLSKFVSVIPSSFEGRVSPVIQMGLLWRYQMFSNENNGPAAPE